jgi:hypothetical protein
VLGVQRVIVGLKSVADGQGKDVKCLAVTEKRILPPLRISRLHERKETWLQLSLVLPVARSKSKVRMVKKIKTVETVPGIHTAPYLLSFVEAQNEIDAVSMAALIQYFLLLT